MKLCKITTLLITAAISWATTAGPIYTNADNIIYEANDENNKIVALKNVDILGTKYDLNFSGDNKFSCNTSYNNCFDGALFGNKAATDEIVNQLSLLLIDDIVIAGVKYDLDSVTNQLDGCANSTQCRLLVPYATHPNFSDRYQASRFFNNTGQAVDSISTFSNKVDWVNFNQNYVIYTKSSITPSTPSVPEPTTLAIFALGLFGLTARRKMTH